MLVTFICVMMIHEWVLFDFRLTCLMMTSIKSLLGQRYSLVCCFCFYMNLLGLGLSSTSKISSGYVDWPVVYGKYPLQFAFMWGGVQCFWAFLQFLLILEKNKLNFLLVNYQTKCMFGLSFKKRTSSIDRVLVEWMLIWTRTNDL
jgi:hypothetical protein